DMYEVMELLKKMLRPEFLNRIDEILGFHALDQNHVNSIVKMQLEGVKKRLLDQEVTIDFTNDAVAAIAAEGFDPAFGARPLKRTVQRRVLNELSKQLLGGQIQRDAVILVDAVDGTLFFKNVSVESHVD
ncbi:MAG: type VI secretion system ATPase TssH, partial [Schleiferiaceae bacterium]